MRPRRGYPPASHAWQCPAPTTQEAAARALRPVRRARADAPRGDARGGARAALAERGEPGQRDGETRMEQPVARWEMLHRRLGADDRCSSLAGDSYVKYCDLGDSITTVLSRGGVLDLCMHMLCICMHMHTCMSMHPTRRPTTGRSASGVWSPGVCLEYVAIRCGSVKRHVSFLRTARTVGTTWTWPVEGCACGR